MLPIQRILLFATLCTATPLSAQEGATATSQVFRSFADAVVKIQVIDTHSAGRATTGSGFFASESGELITNYHVIAQLIHDPHRYRAELIDVNGAVSDVAILAIDVIHDLALLRAPLRPARHLGFATAGVSQGTRLYSLGHPGDLGLSIVEGTYNGLLQHTLYPKVHFTGSINPGMSGGPTITADGLVVGINVATAGNQLSFLVPAENASVLLVRAGDAEPVDPAVLLEQVGRQVTMYQEAYLNGMFDDAVESVELGPFLAPTQPAPFFLCHGGGTRPSDLPYRTATHQCSTDDYIFIAGDQSTGLVELTHELITTTSLNSFRFGALYTRTFSRDNTPYGVEEHVTSWRCRTRNVRNDTTPLRAVLCVRAYRKFDGLFDAVLKTAVLGRRDAGLVSTLTLYGVSYASIETLTSRYLKHITWR